MLADYTQELLESSAQLSLEDFLKNLQSSGVMKGGAKRIAYVVDIYDRDMYNYIILYMTI